MSTPIIAQHYVDARATIAESITISASDTNTSKTFRRSGLYLVQNMGPDIVNLRVYPESGGTYTATTTDFPLSPLGSGDLSAMPFLVSSNTKSNFSAGNNTLHAICATGKTATLVVTKITRD